MAEMTIRRLGVMSVAKIQALLMFVIGLIIGVIYGLIFMVFGAAIAALAPRAEGQTMGGVGSVVGGLAIMVVFPILYGFLGFIGGAVGALVYNVAAGVVGGIKLELESAVPDYAAPPTPPHYA
jgi:hypothetical protein